MENQEHGANDGYAITVSSTWTPVATPEAEQDQEHEHHRAGNQESMVCHAARTRQVVGGFRGEMDWCCASTGSGLIDPATLNCISVRSHVVIILSRSR